MRSNKKQQPTFDSYIKINKEAWNKRTPIHLNSNFYNNTLFKQELNSLKPIEIEALGSVKGKSLLHLQCHFGQDSISLAKMGAKVTGVDFSNIAIAEARKLAHELNASVRFVEDDVLNLTLGKEFDVIFSSYGVLGWLPDLNQWGGKIAQHLKKDGVFLLTEFHPFLELIKNNGYDYFYNSKPDVEVANGSYTDGGNNLTTKTCWWNHSLTEIFEALENNGLKLKLFKEYDYSPFCLEGMVKFKNGKYVLKNRGNLSTPYVFNLKAVKK
tara:strand:+ start:1866 stop:2672 length:807 start_codon:yes stop_codon:yes gene_type:complete